MPKKEYQFIVGISPAMCSGKKHGFGLFKTDTEDITDLENAQGAFSMKT